MCICRFFLTLLVFSLLSFSSLFVIGIVLFIFISKTNKHTLSFFSGIFGCGWFLHGLHLSHWYTFSSNICFFFPHDFFFFSVVSPSSSFSFSLLMAVIALLVSWSRFLMLIVITFLSILTSHDHIISHSVMVLHSSPLQCSLFFLGVIVLLVCWPWFMVLINAIFFFFAPLALLVS